MPKKEFSTDPNKKNDSNSTSKSFTKIQVKESQVRTKKCCKEVKCKCTSFLWRGVNVDLGSSDEGMYGETREKGLRNIFHKMSNYGFDETAVLLDIGSGRGVPNIVASYQNLPFSSVGVELDEKAYYLSLSNLLYVLENDLNIKNANILKENVSINEHPDSLKKKTIFPKNRIGFFKADATSLDTFEPVTHVYSFDAAMPIWMVKKFVDLFNISKTTYCYVSYRKDLVETLGLDGKKTHGISTQMMGSGEGRMCWLYLKDDWEKIKIFSKKYIIDNYKKTPCFSNIEKHKLSKISNLHQIIEFSTLSIHTQKLIIENALDEWFKTRKSRKDCLLERKIMNQRHKELKKLFNEEKLRKENQYQLTLEDFGVSTKPNTEIKNDGVFSENRSFKVKNSSYLKSKSIKTNNAQEKNINLQNKTFSTESNVATTTLKITESKDLSKKKVVRNKIK